MEKGDIITLSNGKKATILNADTTRYKNIIIAETQAQEILVVDRETLSPTRPKRANMF
ncbi:bacteriocin [Lactococcus nasutitermitis]|uniref:Bacteriocin n=1 Tax=Lactococcus nasutitermitis TaxID=1652957 RepID=A0ABV9JGS3_9LACT|nr:bacteriocin [Lactococcus nasutitermitis]